MNDIELANKVIALGIGHQGEGISIDGVGFYHTPENECGETEGLSARLFVHEPSVAMAAMEKALVMEQMILGWNLNKCGDFWCDFPDISLEEDIGKRNDSLTRAIIEACTEALS